MRDRRGRVLLPRETDPAVPAASIVIALVVTPPVNECVNVRPGLEASAPLVNGSPASGRIRRSVSIISLTAYEIDELSEGFDDVVKFHPTHKDSPVAPKDAIPRMVTEPVTSLRAAVNKKDLATFTQAYDAFTAACNNCHQATNFGFNTVQRPATNPYPNQVFALVRK